MTSPLLNLLYSEKLYSEKNSETSILNLLYSDSYQKSIQKSIFPHLNFFFLLTYALPPQSSSQPYEARITPPIYR